MMHAIRISGVSNEIGPFESWSAAKDWLAKRGWESSEFDTRFFFPRNGKKRVAEVIEGEAIGVAFTGSSAYFNRLYCESPDKALDRHGEQKLRA